MNISYFQRIQIRIFHVKTLLAPENSLMDFNLSRSDFLECDVV